MALNDKWVRDLLNYRRTLAPPAYKRSGHIGSESGHIGRTTCDGALIIYDPEDQPEWLQELLEQQDEDGNVERQINYER
jgi:hypothetical protein